MGVLGLGLTTNKAIYMQIGFAACLRLYFLSRAHCEFFCARVVNDPPDCYTFAYKVSERDLPASIPTEYPQHLNHFASVN